jgi:hypothetical protein
VRPSESKDGNNIAVSKNEFKKHQSFQPFIRLSPQKSFSTPFEGLLSSATRPTVVRFMESFKVDEARIFTRIE